ncbi:MAG: twin-arginine translocase subunit TatC [Planctomycetota bacterium]
MSQDDDDDDPRMTIGQHLEELRWRVLKSVLYVLLATIACLFVQQPLMDWATWPHHKVVETLRNEVRFGEAPKPARDLLSEVSAGDDELTKDLEALRRRELRMLARFDDVTPRFEELQQAQRALRDEVAALGAKAAALGDAATKEQLAELAKAREALEARGAALHTRYRAEALPYVDQRSRVPDMRLMDIKYQGPFLSYLKLAMVVAIFLASPLVARELWGFIAVGLYPHEKRYINYFGPLSLALFVIGGVFGYFLLIPVGLYFLATYAPPEMMAGSFALSDYLSLFITLTVVVGLVFELPLLMSFFTLAGFTSADTYREYRQYFWVAAPIIGAVLTPPDPFTQILLATPMVVLYELGILTSAMIGKRRAESADELGEDGDGEVIDVEARPSAAPRLEVSAVDPPAEPAADAAAAAEPAGAEPAGGEPAGAAPAEGLPADEAREPDPEAPAAPSGGDGIAAGTIARGALLEEELPAAAEAPAMAEAPSAAEAPAAAEAPSAAETPAAAEAPEDPGPGAGGEDDEYDADADADPEWAARLAAEAAARAATAAGAAEAAPESTPDAGPEPGGADDAPTPQGGGDEAN